MPAVLKKGLGKGLDALISDSSYVNDAFGARINERKNGVVFVDIHRIEPNKQQPRKYFNEEALNQLAESIKEYGILQPLLVSERDGYYSIVAGERRWRAARIAKLQTVPVLIKDYTELETLQIALIENIQRQDLNPIEEAFCFKKLIDDFFFTQDDIASKIGRSRSAVSYSVSLLTLDPRVQEFIAEGLLTAGHCRLLTQISDPETQLKCAETIIDKELTIRDAERLINSMAESHEKPAATEKNIDYQRVEEDLKSILGTKVHIQDGKKKGKIEIEYYSKDELDRLIGLIKNFTPIQ